MALITFNFTHIWLFVLECLSPRLLEFKLHKEQHPFSWHLYTQVCSSQLWLNVKFIWRVRKILMSKPYPRPIQVASLKHMSRYSFSFVFKEELRTLTHYLSQYLAPSRPSSHVNLHKWHKTRSLWRRWSLLTQREEQKLVGTEEWHGQRAFYGNRGKKTRITG